MKQKIFIDILSEIIEYINLSDIFYEAKHDINEHFIKIDNEIIVELQEKKELLYFNIIKLLGKLQKGK